MKRMLDMFLKVFLPCLLVFGTIGYSTMTDAQKERYMGQIVWDADTLNEDDLPIIDTNGRLRPVEALADSYGRWYHYIIGSASAYQVVNPTPGIVYTRPMDVAGFSKMTIQMYYSVSNVSDIDDATQGALTCSGAADFVYYPYGSTFPASRLDDATPTIASALPVGPWISGATIAVASSPAGLSNTYSQSNASAYRPIKPPDTPVDWLGVTQWDINGIASLVLELSPAATSPAGPGSSTIAHPTTIVLVRVTR